MFVNRLVERDLQLQHHSPKASWVDTAAFGDKIQV
jgi:hypothetical protein